MSLSVEHVPGGEDRSSTGGAGVPIAIVHGFTQNAACLRPFAISLIDAIGDVSGGASIALIDAPGHGRSEHDTADLIDAGRLLVDAGGDAHYVGYSMGGRMLLHAAVLFPERFASLTLIGATAGIDDRHERAARATADEQLAERLESVGLPAFLDEWLALPLFASLTDEAAARAERLTNRSAGLAASLRHCGTGNQFPLWHHLGSMDVPVQIVAGRADAKFTAIGERMVEALPNARFDPIAGGHAVHSERPAEVAKAIASFIADVRAGFRSGDRGAES